MVHSGTMGQGCFSWTRSNCGHTHSHTHRVSRAWACFSALARGRPPLCPWEQHPWVHSGFSHWRTDLFHTVPSNPHRFTPVGSADQATSHCPHGRSKEPLSDVHQWPHKHPLGREMASWHQFASEWLPDLEKELSCWCTSQSERPKPGTQRER